ncbi:MAG: hypothetical protein M3Q19_00390 [Pseudomonadota bacterium]|nr:hypothetical protein [Pseudomonadota bacterium]
MIVELSSDEINQIEGGAIGCLIVAVAVGAVFLAGYIGYQAEHNSDNQNETNR